MKTDDSFPDDGDAVGAGDVDGFHPRFRVCDYGVISLALTRPFSGAGSELVALGQTLSENDDLEQRAERLCRAVADRLQPALKDYREEYLTQDYLVYAVHELDRPQSADDQDARRSLAVRRRTVVDDGGQFLELTIVLILVFKLALIFLGVMQ